MDDGVTMKLIGWVRARPGGQFASSPVIPPSSSREKPLCRSLPWDKTQGGKTHLLMSGAHRNSRAGESNEPRVIISHE